MLFVDVMWRGKDRGFGVHEGENRGLSFLMRKSGPVRQKQMANPVKEILVSSHVSSIMSYSSRKDNTWTSRRLISTGLFSHRNIISPN